MFTVKLLGCVGVDGPDGPLTGAVTQRRQLALLAYLSLHDHPVSRDKLLGVFWPEADTERARHSLSDAVYLLRRTLGDEALLSRGDDLLLDRHHVGCDVAAFRRAVAAEDLADAARRYVGPLLDGFHVSGAPEFEHWLDLQRAQLSQEQRKVLEALALRAEGAGDWAGAAEWWSRVATLEPGNTRVALALMRALAGAGDRAAAVRHATVHARLQQDEYGLDPDPEVLDFAVQLRAADAPVLESVPATDVEPPANGTASQAIQGGEENPPPALRGAPGGRRRGVVLALAVCVVLASAYALLPRQAARGLDAQRVVVAPLENRTGDPSLDVYGLMAADNITRALLNAGMADVVVPLHLLSTPGGDQRGRPPEPVTPRSMALENRAGTVILGAFYQRGDSLEFHVQITDVQRGQVEAALEPVRGALGDPSPAIEELRLRTLTEFHARQSLPAGFNPVRDLGYRTPAFSAYHLYRDGMDHFFRYDMPGAAERLEAVYRSDTTFLAALIWAGVAHLNMGQQSAADSIVRILAARADRLTQAERLQQEWLAGSARGDREAAHRVAQVLADRLPRSPWKYQAARNAVTTNHPRNALRHLAALDSTQGWVPQWPGYWEVLSGAHHLLGRHVEELRVARHGRRRFPQPQPERLLLYEGRALAALGRWQELASVLDEANQLSVPAFGVTPGFLMRQVALELRAHGHHEAAGAAFDRAAEWYLSRPVEEKRRWALPLAETFYAAGRWTEGEVLFRALADADPANTTARGYLGVLAARRGDRETALRTDSLLAHQAAEISPGERRRRLLWRARIAAQLGELERAIGLLRNAEPAFDTHVDPDFEVLREHTAFRALLRPRG